MRARPRRSTCWTAHTRPRPTPPSPPPPERTPPHSPPPPSPRPTTALATLLIDGGTNEGKAEALDLLARIPETEATRHLAAQARMANPDVPADVESVLDALLAKVKADEDAKQQYHDMLELMGPSDPRTVEYRKKLGAALF